MKSTEIRQNLERNILRLKSLKKPLGKSDFEQYVIELKSLHRLNSLYALEQKRIYTCTHGSISAFLSEFFCFTAPLLHRAGKEINLRTVHDPRTIVCFSPRITEVALGCMMCEFLKLSDNMSIDVFCTSSGVAIAASGKRNGHESLNTRCIMHISRLHSGQFITISGKTLGHIALTFPYSPKFQALKVVPCSTELCRLCHI